MIYYTVILSVIIFHLQVIVSTHAVPSCATDFDAVQPVNAHLGESVHSVCPQAPCSGEFVFEHYNLSTLQYDVIQEGSSYTTSIDVRDYSDAGSYRCWKKCNNDTSTESSYCYLIVEVMPATIEANFPPATLNNNYMGTCSATGNPVPLVDVTVNSEDCPYSTSYTNTSQYTGQLVVTIPQVGGQCEGVVIYCHTGQVVEMITLNIIESTEKPSTSSISHIPYVITDRPLNGKYTNGMTSSDCNTNFLVLTILVTVATLWFN